MARDRGDGAAVIQAVARHTSSQTTLGYINAATLLRHRGVKVFPLIPAELVEAAPGFGSVLPRGKTQKKKPR